MGLNSETAQFVQAVRMIECLRNPNPKYADLLDALLNGFERNVTNVLKIRAFARKHFGSKEILSSDTDKIIEVCDEFLAESGVTPPAEVTGKFKNVLEEMDYEERLMTLRLERFCADRGREYRRADGTFDECLTKYCHDAAFRAAIDARYPEFGGIQ